MSINLMSINLMSINLALAPMLVFWLLLSSTFAWADAPAQQPNVQQPPVSFSPAEVDFGLVPSDTNCMQLVTVTFDRRMFSPEHLPTLQPNQDAQADVSLFARFDSPDFIRLVYRVTVNAFFQIGPFQDHLSLVDNTKRSALYPLGTPVENIGINIIGESVQGFEAPTQTVDFGNVKAGASKLKSLTIGFYAPSMARFAPRGKYNRVLFPPAPIVISRSVALEKDSATSTSPYFTAQKLTIAGLNASIWQVWTVTFKSHLPLGRMNAEVRFKTPDGYCATVPVTAEVIPASKPELHMPKKR